MKTDTPRTDSVAHVGYTADAYIAHMTQLCRAIERENAECRAIMRSALAALNQPVFHTETNHASTAHILRADAKFARARLESIV
jgi:hypothetical protein